MDKLVSLASLFLSLVILKVVLLPVPCPILPILSNVLLRSGFISITSLSFNDFKTSDMSTYPPWVSVSSSNRWSCSHTSQEDCKNCVNMKILVWNKTKTIYKPCYDSGHFSQFSEPLKHTLTVKQKVKYQLAWFPLFVKHNFSQVLKGGNKLIKYPLVTMCLKWSLFYQFW